MENSTGQINQFLQQIHGVRGEGDFWLIQNTCESSTVYIDFICILIQGRNKKDIPEVDLNMD